jgi:PilZ domain
MPYPALGADGDRWEPHMIENRGSELRKSERHLTFRTGRIVAASHDYSLECAILNVSQHGACILVPVGAKTEDRFTLFIDGSDEARLCTVAWREGSRIGVSYD